MIVLDTNVVSEVMTGEPTSPALTWLTNQSTADLRISAVTVMEISYGLSRLPNGRKKNRLSTFWDGIVDVWAANILVIDLDSARLAGEMLGMRSHAGRPLHFADALIAAVSLRHGAALATRNVKDFGGLGLTLVNPWLP
ncbi:MAG: type II toxin-antitoxin system VapC family toxin [Candidatus Nanopelagicales bacterium]|nr:type II toxin-antitoxin system VapC family toxin [Candidatus Nanopelagicales bacterium]